jgi:hypothetical protein
MDKTAVFAYSKLRSMPLSDRISNSEKTSRHFAFGFRISKIAIMSEKILNKERVVVSFDNSNKKSRVRRSKNGKKEGSDKMEFNVRFGSKDFDPLGMYTGVSEGLEKPEQDADDL